MKRPPVSKNGVASENQRQEASNWTIEKKAGLTHEKRNTFAE